MTRDISLSSDQLSTIRLALMGWGVRCEREALEMEKLAADLPEYAEKALANAAASRSFKEEAETVLAYIQTF